MDELEIIESLLKDFEDGLPLDTAAEAAVSEGAKKDVYVVQHGVLTPMHGWRAALRGKQKLMTANSSAVRDFRGDKRTHGDGDPGGKHNAVDPRGDKR